MIMHRIVVAAHDPDLAHVIGHDPVAALARQLGAGVGLDVVGLGGEADHQPRPLRTGARQGGQDIGILHQAQGRRPVLALLQLDPEHLVGAPVGHGGDADGDVGGQGGLGGVLHLDGGPTWMRRTPAGAARAVGPETRVTSAPSRARAAAMA